MDKGDIVEIGPFTKKSILNYLESIEEGDVVNSIKAINYSNSFTGKYRVSKKGKKGHKLKNLIPGDGGISIKGRFVFLDSLNGFPQEGISLEILEGDKTLKGKLSILTGFTGNHSLYFNYENDGR